MDHSGEQDIDDYSPGNNDDMKHQRLVQANFLFNKVSRKRLDNVMVHMKGLIPSVGRYYPQYKLVLERPY